MVTNYMAVPGLRKECVPLVRVEKLTPSSQLYFGKELNISKDTMIQLITKAFDVCASDIKGASRQAKKKMARWVFYRMMFDKGYNLSEIARECNRDHTSIRYALMEFDSSVRFYPFAQMAIEEIKKALIIYN